MLAVTLALSVVDAGPSLAAARLSLSPTNPVAREYIKLAGRFGTSVQRPVRLEYWNGSRWALVDSKSTTSAGAFSFRTRAVAPSRKFRAHAPRFTKNGRTYADLKSDPRTVRTVTPTARLKLVPAKVGQSKAGTKNLTPGTARFTPVRRGRGVVVQHYANGRWNDVRSGAQNRRGTFAFNLKASSGQTYRAVTVAKNGAPAKESAKVAARYLSLGFKDNFNSFDTSKWEVRQPGWRNIDGGRPCSESSHRSVSVNADGKLVLRTRRIAPDNPDYDSNADCPYGQYYNGHIGTAGKFDFKRGIMAARIKMQPQRGHHGGFWSQPSGADGAEIDTVEYYGDNYPKAIVQHGAYKGDAHPKIQKNRDYLLRAGEEWSSGYHVFSVQWTRTQYIFRIDGHETYRTNEALSQANQYLILSLLASQWELKSAYKAGQLPSSKAWAPMYVDWVRVWNE